MIGDTPQRLDALQQPGTQNSQDQIPGHKSQASERPSDSKILSPSSPVPSLISLSDLGEEELALSQKTKKRLLKNRRKMNSQPGLPPSSDPTFSLNTKWISFQCIAGVSGGRNVRELLLSKKKMAINSRRGPKLMRKEQ